MKRIHEGVKYFQSEVFPKQRRAYEELPSPQKPAALFITCGDSRINPELLTNSGPGEIFVERNPGNLVPVYDHRTRDGVSASIEFAVLALHVPSIIICGHSDCGAMNGILNPTNLPAVSRWLHFAAKPPIRLNGQSDAAWEETLLGELTKLNVLQQMENLQTHPCVADRVKAGKLAVAGWVYQIHTGQVEVYNPMLGCFEQLR